MTLDELTRMFPDRSFALYRVARGPSDRRRLVWKANWDAGYFTSDTDRHVQLGGSSAYFGDTPEEALGALAQSTLDAAQQRVRLYEEELAKAQLELDRAASALGQAKS